MPRFKEIDAKRPRFYSEGGSEHPSNVAPQNSDWETLAIPMLYAAIYYLLLARRIDDRFSIDYLCRRNSSRLHAGTKIEKETSRPMT
jgi:hypothetical protein